MEIATIVPDLLCRYTAVGFGYRGKRERLIKEKRNKERKKEITSPGSSMDAADRVARVLGVPTHLDLVVDKFS